MTRASGSFRVQQMLGCIQLSALFGPARSENLSVRLHIDGGFLPMYLTSLAVQALRELGGQPQ